MRKPSYLLAALLVCATPAVAQQAADVTVAPSAPAQSQTAPTQQAPSLFVSDAEIRDQLREQDQKQGSEEQATAQRQMPSNFLWLAGAIALGVIVAFVILD